MNRRSLSGARRTQVPVRTRKQAQGCQVLRPPKCRDRKDEFPRIDDVHGNEPEIHFHRRDDNRFHRVRAMSSMTRTPLIRTPKHCKPNLRCSNYPAAGRMRWQQCKRSVESRKYESPYGHSTSSPFEVNPSPRFDDLQTRVIVGHSPNLQDNCAATFASYWVTSSAHPLDEFA